MNKNTTIFILIGVIILLILMHFRSCTKNNQSKKDNENLIEALHDTLTTERQQNGTLKASISVIQTERTKDFIKLQLKDRELAELQELVKEYKKVLIAGSSVTKGLIETVARLHSQKPPTIVKVDTVKGDDSISYVYPTYEDSVVDKWVNVKGIMSKDSSNFSIQVNNEFTAIMGYDKKEKKPFIEYNLMNPYSTMRKLRSYQVSVPKPKRWNVSIGGGYGVNANFVDLKDVKNNLFFGIFTGYSLIRF